MNKKIFAGGKPEEQLLCERKSDGEKVICSCCKGVFNKTYFYRHKQHCSSKTATDTVTPVLPATLSQETKPEKLDLQWEDLLQRMAKDEFFSIIKSDPCIILIGKHIYASKKPAKEKEARVKCRSAMRRLAKLVHLTEDITQAKELFLVENVYKLEDAIIQLCTPEEENTAKKAMKAGLKIALGSLIRLSAKILTADYLIKKKKDDAEEVEAFEKVFNMNYAKNFAEAEYRLKEKRQRENRKPSALPSEQDLEKLRAYLTKEIESCTEQMEEKTTKQQYVHLRKITLTRITTVNARRGSEAARMLIEDYEEKDDWINQDKLSSDEKKLTEEFKVVFIMGKGNTLVPVFIPRDCIRAMDILANEEKRKQAGVAPDNEFLFAYTQDSDLSITGYNEIRDICKDIGIPVITATSIRHRSSTIFWNLEGINEQVVDSFMQHMGHTKEIDKDIYAVPPGLKALRDVTPIINRLDQVNI